MTTKTITVLAMIFAVGFMVPTAFAQTAQEAEDGLNTFFGWLFNSIESLFENQDSLQEQIDEIEFNQAPDLTPFVNRIIDLEAKDIQQDETIDALATSHNDLQQSVGLNLNDFHQRLLALEALHDVQPPPPTLVCGDGILSPEIGEQCDDGNLNNGDGCSDICEFETSEYHGTYRGSNWSVRCEDDFQNIEMYEFNEFDVVQGTFGDDMLIKFKQFDENNQLQVVRTLSGNVIPTGSFDDLNSAVHGDDILQYYNVFDEFGNNPPLTYDTIFMDWDPYLSHIQWVDDNDPGITIICQNLGEAIQLGQYYVKANP